MLRFSRVLGVFLLGAASLLMAATPAAAGAGANFTLPAAIRTTYSISGTVRVNATSAVLPNVSVLAINIAGTAIFGSGSAVTSAAGTYTISNLLPGSYTVKFDPLRTTGLQHGYRTSTAPLNFSASTPGHVVITAASVSGVNVRLPGGFTISGKVTRSNGTTVIAGVDVGALGPNGSDDGTTDSAGNFKLVGLSPGSYEVSFGHDVAQDNQTGCWFTTPASKFSASCVAHTPVTITSANIVGINSKIPNALKITGYVKSRAATPAPIAGAWIDAEGPASGSAYTDATGKYTIVGLNPGSYKLLVYGPPSSSIVPGLYYSVGPNYWTLLSANGSSKVISAAVTTMPIIKPPVGFYIRGKITNTSGTPRSGVAVYAVGGASTGTDFHEAGTDAAGNYSVGPLVNGGTYTIFAQSTTWSSDPTLQSGYYIKSPPNDFTTAKASAFALHVTGDVIGVNMRLPKGASISGVVSLTGGGACSSCVVYAIDSTGTVVNVVVASISGAYTLVGLSAGSYRVEALLGARNTDPTHVQIVTPGYYKFGVANDYGSTLAGATAIAVVP